eukprot:TRINITY_DN4712_c1_g1_i1.p1 TRINITY_DN4712_c1_g1~~TRINITY_DN4712_c1_g1_i1.p1  ORF type:complete len:509 (+),score=83.40 TRINITY_DN4712_c1_g1_i1:122-1528(+)
MVQGTDVAPVMYCWAFVYFALGTLGLFQTYRLLSARGWHWSYQKTYHYIIVLFTFLRGAFFCYAAAPNYSNWTLSTYFVLSELPSIIFATAWSVLAYCWARACHISLSPTGYASSVVKHGFIFLNTVMYFLFVIFLSISVSASGDGGSAGRAYNIYLASYEILLGLIISIYGSWISHSLQSNKAASRNITAEIDKLRIVALVGMLHTLWMSGLLADGFSHRSPIPRNPADPTTDLPRFAFVMVYHLYFEIVPCIILLRIMRHLPKRAIPQMTKPRKPKIRTKKPDVEMAVNPSGEQTEDSRPATPAESEPDDFEEPGNRVREDSVFLTPEGVPFFLNPDVASPGHVPQTLSPPAGQLSPALGARFFSRREHRDPKKDAERLEQEKEKALTSPDLHWAKAAGPAAVPDPIPEPERADSPHPEKPPPPAPITTSARHLSVTVPPVPAPETPPPHLPYLPVSPDKDEKESL